MHGQAAKCKWDARVTSIDSWSLRIAWEARRRNMSRAKVTEQDWYTWSVNWFLGITNMDMRKVDVRLRWVHDQRCTYDGCAPLEKKVNVNVSSKCGEARLAHVKRKWFLGWKQHDMLANLSRVMRICFTSYRDLLQSVNNSSSKWPCQSGACSYLQVRSQSQLRSSTWSMAQMHLRKKWVQCMHKMGNTLMKRFFKQIAKKFRVRALESIPWFSKNYLRD